MLLSFIIHYAPFNDGYEMIPSSWKYNAPYVLCTAGFAAFTGLLAGIAPAWILSAFKPLRVLKNLSTAKLFGKVGLQKSLIVFQYSLSLVIIIFLFTFYRQFSFMGSRDPGFKRDGVMVVPLGAANAAIAAQQMATVSGVQTVAGLSTTFNGHFQGQRSGAWVDKQQQGMSLNYFFTDPYFIPSMKLGLLAGRNFDATADTSLEREIILNGRAALGLGFKTYEAALGKRVWVNDTLALSVVGVVNDFNYENAGKPVDPMAFRNKKSMSKYLFIGVGNGDKEAVTARMAAAWKGVAPGQAFVSSWLDDDLENNNSQKATLSLLGYLAFMALSIATLGLLGLVIYTVETRRKEIGIRKVVGAGKKEVVTLLSKSFIRLLFIAGAIAIPIGYTLSYFFLLNFANRVGYGLVAAMGCFAFLLSIGLVTVVSQTYKASRENPVNSLRTE
jgi:putative ABC transport system permease protein